MKRIFGILFSLFIVLGTNIANAALRDSTSFDPTHVAIKPLSTDSTPVGVIREWPFPSDPPDMNKWLECNGQSITQAAYPELFALVGGNVPDFRGLFLRGHGSQVHVQENGSMIGVTATTHVSGVLGAVQGDASRNVSGILYSGMAVIENNHISTWKGIAWPGRGPRADGYPHWNEGEIYLDLSRVTATASENRPVNVAVRYLIRARP
jgi:hypothetical protein